MPSLAVGITASVTIMMEKKRYRGIASACSCIIFVICLLLVATHWAWAENIDDTDKYAWSENAGWLNWKSTHAQAAVDPSCLSGYVWAENIGWIKLGVDGGGPYDNSDSTNWGVNRDIDTGKLSGYAWSENAGWINFNPTYGGVTITAATGTFDGHAWGKNIGR
jgi:hypothetical protein